MADGIAAEKLDFWVIPKLDQGLDNFTNTLSKANFSLLEAMPLSSRPILPLMYR